MTAEGTGFPGGPQASAGWYPDPWFSGQHRYWDGKSWTAHSFPEGPGPGGAPERGSTLGIGDPSPLPTAGVSGDAPPPPEWRAPRTDDPRASPPPPDVPAVADGTRGRSLWPPRGRALVAALIALGFVVGLLGGALVSAHRRSTPTASAPPAVTPAFPGTNPVTPTAPSDPAGSVLQGLVLRQADVAATVTVGPIPGGTDVAGGATLDLCNGTFPSESLRTARLQVAALDQGTETLSTEAVLYSTSAGAAQAFSELGSTSATCPASPVASPVGEPTITTHFNSAPDGSWPQVPGVERLAFDFMTTDASGQAQHNTAVYLRRGRALIGIYFSHPDGPQTAVDGQTTMAGIVNVFATRIANLAPSVVDGG
jgi:hypothetical protein